MSGSYKIDRFLAAWIAIPVFLAHANYFFPESLKTLLSPSVMLAFSFFLYISLSFIKNPRLSFVPELQLLILFFVILAIGLIYTNAIEYGSSKLNILYFWLFVFYLYGFIIINNFDIFAKSCFLFGVIFIILLFQKFGDPISFFKSMQGEIIRLGATEDGSGNQRFALNPIWVARYLGFLFLVALYTLTQKKRNFIGYIYLLFLFSYMITSGSKGPILSLIAGCAVFFADSRLSANLRNIFIFLIIILVLIFLLNLIDFFSSSFYISRFSGESSSGSDREELIDEAIKFRNISYFFFGSGTGDFGYFMNKSDSRHYPHNIFAELFFETGVIGIVIILMMWYTVMKKIALILRHKRLRLICAIFVFFGLNTMFSGDLAANQFFFIFFVLFHFEAKVVSREEEIAFKLQENNLIAT